MTVLDTTYRKPLQYEILIKDSETFETIDTYSMQNYSSNRMGLTSLEFNSPYGQIPQLSMEFHDPGDWMDLDLYKKGNIVIVQGTKDIALFPLVNMAYTRIERVREMESIEGNSFYAFECVGTSKIIYDSVINYVRNPQYKNLKKEFSNIDVKNEDYTVYQHLINILTNKDVLPSNFGYTLQERGNFGIDEVSEKIRDVYPSISKTYAKASDVINELADFAGCVWGVDEYNQIYFRRMNEKTNGHIIKSYIEKTRDDDRYTSVILDRIIEKVTSMDSNDGYFDVNYGFVSQSNVYDIGGDIINYTSTFSNHITQRVKAGTSRFRNLTLTLGREGVGTDAEDTENSFVTGHICNDSEGKPGAEIVARFWHPVLQIPTTPTNMSVSITTNPADIDVNAYYWLVLHRIGSGEDNCIRWYHDNLISDEFDDHWSGIRPANPTTTPSGAKVNQITGTDSVYNPINWQLSAGRGPIYSYAFANYSSIPNVSYNPFAYGGGIRRAPVEVVYNINWIKDVYTMQKFLNLMAFAGGQEPLTFQFEKCTIPNIPLRSGYTSQLFTKKIAKRENNGLLGTITNVAYRMSGQNSDDMAGPAGSNTCSVDFVGYFDPLDYKSDDGDPDEGF